MKKLILGLVALSSVTTMAATGDSYLNVRVSGDLAASYTKGNNEGVTVLNDKTAGVGRGIALEYNRKANDLFDFGLGMAYQKHQKRSPLVSGTETISGGSYDSLPLYATAKYNFKTTSLIKPYLKLNLGYSFNDLNTEDVTHQNSETGAITKVGSTTATKGFYWALGGGAEYKDFTIDLLYELTKSKAEVDNGNGGRTKYDNDYGRLALSLGYRFNL